MALLGILKEKLTPSEETKQEVSEVKDILSKRISDVVEEGKKAYKLAQEEQWERKKAKVARAGFLKGIEDKAAQQAIIQRLTQVTVPIIQPVQQYQVAPRRLRREPFFNKPFMSDNFMSDNPFVGDNPFFPRKRR